MPPKKKAKPRAAAAGAAAAALPDTFAVGLVLGAAGAERDQWLRERFGEPRPPRDWTADVPVVSELAKLETGPADERAEKATRRLAACGMNSVPSWLRPYACLSNGEAARVDVAARGPRGIASRSFLSSSVVSSSTRL